MTAPDRLPAILQALQDAAHDADDLVLAAGLAHAVDLHALAPLLPLTGADAMLGNGCYAVVAGRHRGDNSAQTDHALACRVAARLASTAALLLAVDATDHASTAEALWSAAGRLAGLGRGERDAATPMTDADRERLAVHTEAAAMAQRIPGTSAVASASGVTVTFAVPPTQAPVVQVGDIIDAASVPHRSLVECLTNKDLIIRLARGRGGWTLDDDGGPTNGGWPWDGSMHGTACVRVMATDIPADECWQVARMTPAEARDWLAGRVRRQPA